MQLIDRTLLGDLYDAAVDIEKWPDLLDRIACELGSKGATILSVNPTLADSGHLVLKSNSLFTADDIALYQEKYSHYEQEIYAEVSRSKIGDVIMEKGFSFDRGIEEHPEHIALRPDVRFLNDKYGVFHRIGVRINEDSGWLEGLTCQYSNKLKPNFDTTSQYLKILQPHLTQCLYLSRTFNFLRKQFNAVLAALDHVNLPMFIVVGESVHVLLSNRNAQKLTFYSKDISVNSSGRLVINDEKANYELNNGLSKILKTSGSRGDTAKISVVLNRGSYADPCLIEVSPLRDPDSELNGNNVAALITILDPEHLTEINMQGIDIAYSLTKTESAIAQLLVEGCSTKEIANKRDIGNETVKSHISSILQKTRSKNRTELVRRVLMLNSPVM